MSASSGAQKATSKFFDRLFSKESLRYLCTTHFWGPVSNFGIPLAAILDLQNKPPDMISGPMTGSLIVYSLVFMRYSLAIKPQNYLLFGCHFVNEIAQLGQGYRFVMYKYVNDDKKTQVSADQKKVNN
ncbi:BA75_04270T0 [Komagataella pastoris]|uniref:Mitochondrial pyruvate carrier n=1 Tax=Komagataella pastoris TaxID=4922 RepID=A0A1B2JFL2_PICPA|nr:BA75_04270T0 [Komagataella pastoris]